jgi:hypothetical protein
VAFVGGECREDEGEIGGVEQKAYGFAHQLATCAAVEPRRGERFVRHAVLIVAGSHQAALVLDNV